VGDILMVQDDIATAVAKALSASIDDNSSDSTSRDHGSGHDK
jgi:hypothetical protein